MGFEFKTATISATVDKHGGPKQRTDAAMWEELMDALDRVVNQPRFANLNPELSYAKD